MQQVPANRYAYYITPNGFSEKARLTGEYLSTSLEFFRHAREQSSTICVMAANRRLTRLALIGAGELAEITALTALDSPVEIVGVVDPSAAGSRLAGLRVVADIGELDPVEAVIITDMRAPQRTYEEWAERLSADQVLAVDMLKISRAAPPDVGDAT